MRYLMQENPQEKFPSYKLLYLFQSTSINYHINAHFIRFLEMPTHSKMPLLIFFHILYVHLDSNLTPTLWY